MVDYELPHEFERGEDGDCRCGKPLASVMHPNHPAQPMAINPDRCTCGYAVSLHQNKKTLGDPFSLADWIDEHPTPNTVKSKNTAIAPEWSRDEAVRVVEELESLLGRLGANCPSNIRQRVLQARYEAWDELTCERSWEK